MIPTRIWAWVLLVLPWAGASCASCDDAGDKAVEVQPDAGADVAASDAAVAMTPDTAPTEPDGPMCLEGADCDDGLFCNGFERCVEGSCYGPWRSACIDDVDCTIDGCDEGEDVCVFTPDDDLCPNGQICDPKAGCHTPRECVRDADCDDGAFCNGVETCDLDTNQCAPGEPPDCDDGVFCTLDSCDETLAACQNVPDHTLCAPQELCGLVEDCAISPECERDLECDDGSFCNGAERCQDGVCVGGEPPTVDDGVDCTADACSEGQGQVFNVPNPNRCSDGLFCNGAEVCDALEGCLAGVAPRVDDEVPCTVDACDEESDVVTHLPDDGACDDGAFCNGAERCDAAQGCLAGVAPVLDDEVACTADSCDEEADVVLHVPDDAACDDGLYCNGEEVCDVAQGCVGGASPVLDDEVGCTVDTCDEEGDVVLHEPNDGACDDGLYCNGEERCDVDEGCVAGVSPPLSDEVGCTVDMCDEENDVVLHEPDDGECDDGAFCNGAETCDVAQGCLAGEAPVLDDEVGCTADSCDEENDVVLHEPDDGACDDGAFCNGAERCDVAQGCVDGAPPALGDGVGCTVDSCDEEADVVLHVPDDGACDDRDVCTADACHPMRGCEAPEIVVCDGSDGCCADGCNANDDADCDPICGNAVVEPGEACEAALGCVDGARCVGCVCVEQCTDGVDNDGDQDVDCDDIDCQGDPACPFQITLRGWVGDGEGTAAWNATGEGSEPLRLGHLVPEPFNVCGVNSRAYLYQASPDYAGPTPEEPPINANSPGAARVVALQAAWNLRDALASYGIPLGEVRMSFGRMSLGDDVEGVDWYIDGTVETRFYRGGSLVFKLGDEPLIVAEMPPLEMEIDYGLPQVCSDDTIGATTPRFLVDRFSDVTAGAPIEVQEVAQAMLLDLAAAGGLRLVATSLQAAIQYDFDRDGRRGGLFNLPDVRLEATD